MREVTVKQMNRAIDFVMEYGYIETEGIGELIRRCIACKQNDVVDLDESIRSMEHKSDCLYAELKRKQEEGQILWVK